MRKKLVVAVASASIGVVSFASQASAWVITQTWGPVTKDTSGAKASCTVYSGREYFKADSAQITCKIADTSADGNAVYVAWKQDGFATISLYNRSGYNTTVTKTDARYNSTGDSFGTLKWRICRDRQAPWTDNCSAWQEYHPA